MTIKMTIKELRQRAGLTQQQLAEKAGMDAPQLSRIESGERSPGVKVLQRIADALNAPIGLIASANTETKEAPRLKKIYCLDTGIDLFVDENYYEDQSRHWQMARKKIKTSRNAPYI